MRILLTESSCYKPLNPYFAGALEELSRTHGWEFTFVDEAEFFPAKLSLANRLCAKLFGDHSWRRREIFNRSLQETARTFKPDVLLVVNGKMVAPETLRAIKKDSGAKLVNYATDDPYNAIVTTRYFRESVPLFDVYATPKVALLSDPRVAGSCKMLRTYFAYKPELHFKEMPATAEEKRRFECDVAFVGSWDDDRQKFLQALMESMPSLRLSIYGANGWRRYRLLRRYARKEVSGREFRLALGGARVALNFIRRANRDDHSERAFQILASQAFMLSERTDEQVQLFSEGVEAAYFDSPQELVEKVRCYLLNDSERVAIAKAGHRRVTGERHTCKDRLLQILSSVVDGAASCATLTPPLLVEKPTTN